MPCETISVGCGWNFFMHAHLDNGCGGGGARLLRDLFDKGLDCHTLVLLELSC